MCTKDRILNILSSFHIMQKKTKMNKIIKKQISLDITLQINLFEEKKKLEK